MSPLTFNDLARGKRLFVMIKETTSSRTTECFYSADSHLGEKFLERFPQTRESYGECKQDEVLALLSGSVAWKRLGKAWFRRDAMTDIVYRKAPARRSGPEGRITVCVPYKLAFDIVVLEHLRSHASNLESQKPDAFDSGVAIKYTGVDRNQMRFIRQQCRDCCPCAEGTTAIPLNSSASVRSLLVKPSALEPESHPPLNSRVSRVAKVREDLTLSSRSQELVSNPALRYSSIFWIGCEDNLPMSIPTQNLQHRHVTAANSALVPSCFSLETARRLLPVVGPTFLSMDQEQVAAHQSIVTASIMADEIGPKFTFQTVRWLQRQLMQEVPSLKPNTILMLAWRQYNAEHAAIVQWIHAHTKDRMPCDVRMFPSALELEHANGKIDDIRVLDEVARDAPVNWSFRPITCHGISECCLGTIGVLKRTNSCGSEHIVVNPTASDVARLLRCQSRRRSKRHVGKNVERWFHQEFVDGLRTLGEFRVFIITKADQTAVRGRKGVIVEVVHTLELPDRELVVTVLSSSSTWPNRHHNWGNDDLQELKSFALYMFNALRDRPDSLTAFESLEIGVRLDIGISIHSETRQFFLNEVTRIYEADFFSEWLAQPGTQICRAASAALKEVFFAESV